MNANYRNVAKTNFRRAYRLLPFKRPALRFIRAIGASRWIPYRLKPYLVFAGPFNVQVEQSEFTMLNGFGREIETAIFWDGLEAFERSTIPWWCELSKRSKYIVDIGANTGIYSLVVKALNPDAVVHAFEPLERIHEILQENISLNTVNSPPINAHRIALSDYSGQGEMFDLPVEHIYTASLNRNVHAERGQPMLAVQESVAVLRLDDFPTQQAILGLDLIKIDVESHEPAVLRGMGECLRRYHPAMIVEIWNNEAGAAVEAAPAECDYVYFALTFAQPKRMSHIRNNAPERGFINCLVCTQAMALDLGILNFSCTQKCNVQ